MFDMQKHLKRKSGKNLDMKFAFETKVELQLYQKIVSFTFQTLKWYSYSQNQTQIW